MSGVMKEAEGNSVTILISEDADSNLHTVRSVEKSIRPDIKALGQALQTSIDG